MVGQLYFDITGVPLETALAVAFIEHSTAVGWKYRMIDEQYTLVLHWNNYAKDDINPFPAPLRREEVLPIVGKWLSEAEYGEEPDGDGHAEKSHRIFSLQNSGSAFVAIQPVWLYYGK